MVMLQRACSLILTSVLSAEEPQLPHADLFKSDCHLKKEKQLKTTYESSYFTKKIQNFRRKINKKNRYNLLEIKFIFLKAIKIV